MSSYALDLAAAESTRQASKKANNTAAGHLAADIAYYQTAVTLGRTYGVRNNARQALINLGGSPPADSWQTGE